MEVDETRTVQIPCAEAYGERHEQLVQEVPKSALPDEIQPQVGMQLQSQSPDGQVMNLTVTEVLEETITVDANHPLAGMNLNFKIKILEVRQATEDEKAHSHACTGCDSCH